MPKQFRGHYQDPKGKFFSEMISNGKTSLFLECDLETRATKENFSYTLEREGAEPIDIYPIYPDQPTFGASLWPSKASTYTSDAQLLTDMRAFIHRWADLPEHFEQVAALYTMFTWVYDDFMECPYLRIIADLGSGKSRLGIDVLGSIVYKPIRTIAVSSMPSLFRTIHSLRGTLVLDEADLGEHSDKTADMVQLLNSGYKANVPVMRTKMIGNNYEVESFNLFGPKIIMSREHMKDHALESRCLPIRMTETRRDDLPLLIDKTLEDQALILRNQLLRFRFNNFRKDNKPDEHFLTLNISSRLKQLFLLLSTVSDDPDIRTMLYSYAASVQEASADLRGETWEGEVIHAVYELLKTRYCSSDQFPLSLTEITTKINLEREKQITNRGVGKTLRENLGLETYKSHGVSALKVVLVELNTTFRRFGLEAIEPKLDKIL